jgi:hypothetical protein
MGPQLINIDGGRKEDCIIIDGQLSSVFVNLNTDQPQPAPALTMATARPITVMIPKDRSMVPTPPVPPGTSGILESLKLVVSGVRVVVSEVGPSVAGSKSSSVVGGWLLNQP